MKKSIWLILAVALLSGCVSNPVPKDYTGPLAYISDSTAPSETPGVDFFVLDAVNGQAIQDSISATMSANYGRGFYMDPKVIGRDVPAREASFEVLGMTHYAAPILAMTNTVYKLNGTVTFTPAPNGRYVIKGKLGAGYSAVWIEEVDTGKIVGQKIEKQLGSE